MNCLLLVALLSISVLAFLGLRMYFKAAIKEADGKPATKEQRNQILLTLALFILAEFIVAIACMLLI